jgi:hypothetical protein
MSRKPFREKILLWLEKLQQAGLRSLEELIWVKSVFCPKFRYKIFTDHTNLLVGYY